MAFGGSLGVVCSVLHDVEAVRQEAQLLREQMQIVKDDIRKVEGMNSSFFPLVNNDRWTCMPAKPMVLSYTLCSGIRTRGP